jgi:phage baseplate assembly protein W
LDLYFTKASGTKDVNKVTDVQAVKRSIRNLVLLNRFEKPFSPYIFGGVVETLFEPMTQVTGILLGKQIESVIGAYEPRALLQEVNVRENFDSNEYDVQIIFTMANNPAEQVELELMLERLR